jgi:nucleotide-binding universal stress UspA family protein
MEQHFQGIVIGYDGSPCSVVALEWAAAMALRQGGPLTVLHSVAVAPIPASPAFSQEIPTVTFDEAPRATLDEGVRRATELLGEAPVIGAIANGGAAANLVEASRTATMVVTGCRAKGRVEAGLLGSVSYAVTAHARCPAVVVRGDRPPLPDREHRVVVGVDDSESSHRALDRAADTAASVGAPLLIVSVGRMHSTEARALAEMAPAGTGHPHGVRPEAAQTVARAKDRVRAAHPELTVETDVLFGHAGQKIAQLGKDAGLIVVGSRGRGGFTGLILGSVSHTVIHEAGCPVMVVHA